MCTYLPSNHLFPILHFLWHTKYKPASEPTERTYSSVRLAQEHYIGRTGQFSGAGEQVGVDEPLWANEQVLSGK